ncbi:hypothetical protein RCL1_004666 [Eukaryota sp. TZLM3-RCL]
MSIPSRLEQETVPLTDNTYWDSFFSFLFSLKTFQPKSFPISFKTVLDTHPVNITSIISHSLSHLTTFINDYIQEFPVQRTLALIRLLSSIFPLIHSSSNTDFIQSLLSEKEVYPSIASSLLSNLVSLCFVPGFTLPDLGITDETPLSDLVWAGGVLNCTSHYVSAQVDQIRTEVIRLISIVVSDPLFQSNPSSSPFLSILTSFSHKFSLPFFISLLNIVISFKSPKLKLIFSDVKTPLFEACLHLLLLILDIFEPIEENQSNITSSLPIYCRILNQIQSEEDQLLIISSLISLIQYPVYCKAFSTTETTVDLALDQECLLLLTKLLFLHPTLLHVLCAVKPVQEYLVPLCQLALELCIEDEIGISELPCLRGSVGSLKLPDVSLIEGTFGDLFLTVCHRIVSKALIKHSHVAKALLTAVVNCSPYFRFISNATIIKYLEFFKKLASPKFLIGHDFSFEIVTLLIEFFAFVIQYQYHTNEHVVYGLLQYEDSFYSLIKLKEIKPEDSKNSVDLAKLNLLIDNSFFQTILRLLESLGSEIKHITKADENTPSPVILRQFINNFIPTGLFTKTTTNYD